VYQLAGRQDAGQTRFFRNQTYHFQTLRVFSEIPFGGADTGEILETVRHVRAGDEQSWFEAWSATGERVLALAEATQDPESRGLALLRAHNYLRTAEFLLPPDDPKRLPTFDRSVDAFYAGLRTLGVAHELSEVPYAGTTLTSVFYPGPAGAAGKPLIVLFGGYDSTLEELYFVLVAAAHQRGYSVLTYEGPGQGAALRKRGLRFTHEWEKPTGAVLDAFLASHPRPPRLVLVGMSMGGFLAPRAAAFDPRFDGVVAYDVFFDLAESGRRYVPPLAFWLHDHGLDPLLSAIVALKARFDPDFRCM
jgi:dipeptidyl aminopeptidase/acylaminoacyl peptidase